MRLVKDDKLMSVFVKKKGKKNRKNYYSSYSRVSLRRNKIF